ncbi:MAG: sigma-70 family RNA polymerase sigma factor [Casimicrobiaceae bacterium]
MAIQEVTDAELIARVVVQDDRAAFGELVRRYQSGVRATLRRLAAGDHGLADDLAQETFLLAYRNLRAFRQEARFSTWLYRIATNAFLAYSRKRREELLGEAADEVADDGGAADARAGGERDHAGGATLRIDMERALVVLSDAERAAIVQCYHNDLSHEEAAYVLGCPVGTVKTHILRAKQKLKNRLAAWAPETS